MKKIKSNRHFFEYLYETYEQRIFYQAYSVLNQKEQAEDITQDVFEQLYQEKEKLQSLDEEHLKKLIITITKNKAIDLYRKNTSQIKYIEDYKESNRGQIPDNNVVDRLEELVSEAEFQEITRELKEPYLQVFMYRIFYGLSTKEVAQIMSQKDATIRKQFERGKKIVKNILGGSDYEKVQ